MVTVKRHADALAAFGSNSLTSRAKGILGYLIACEGQHMTMERMDSDFAECVGTIRKGVKELEESGHLKRVRRQEGQRVWYDWNVTL